MTDAEIVRALKNAHTDPMTPTRYKVALHCAVDRRAHGFFDSDASLEIDRLTAENDRLRIENNLLLDENQSLRAEHKLWIETLRNAPEEL